MEQLKGLKFFYLAQILVLTVRRGGGLGIQSSGTAGLRLGPSYTVLHLTASPAMTLSRTLTGGTPEETSPRSRSAESITRGGTSFRQRKANCSPHIKWRVSCYEKRIARFCRPMSRRSL